MPVECEKCKTFLIEDEYVLVCPSCGLESRRLLDTKIVPFGSFNEPGSQYTRKYRFRTLLQELSGCTRFPDDLAIFMLENRDKFVSPNKLNELLVRADLKRYTSKATAILIWAGRMESPINEFQIKAACDRFQQLDRQIYISSGVKPAFTYLLPIILYLTPGCRDFAKSCLVKQPSTFLKKKYSKVTAQAIKDKGWWLNEFAGVIE